MTAYHRVVLLRFCFRAWVVGLVCTGSLLGACKRREPRQPLEARVAPPPPQSEGTLVHAARADVFPVRVDSFADIRLLRYRVPGFDALTLRQKQLLYYLQEAALSGRDITYDQKYEHNLLVRRTLEGIVTGYRGDRSAPRYAALLTYAKRVWFSNGIHHHVSTKKFVPDGLTPSEFTQLVQDSDPARLPLASGETPTRLAQRLTPVIFDAQVAEKGVNKDAGKDPVRDSANHFYVRLTKDEVVRMRQQLAARDEPSPLSYGLNSQLAKRESGVIEERPWKVGGMYGAALSECVRWLEKAAEVAESPAQRSALELLIAFYRTGDLRTWNRYNIAWLADTEGKIDLIHGFIETYGDAIGLRGTYEAIVQLEDPAANSRIHTLSREAQWFEDHSTIPDEYKKDDVVGINARVVEVVIGAGETGTHMPIGVNLPNESWLRQQYGSKSIALGNLLAAHDRERRDSGQLEEFAASSREIDRDKAHGALAQAVLTELHEVVGHASGKLAPGVGPASETLQNYAATLEEARADLVALYYLLDPKLVALRVLPSLEVGRAAYDMFVRRVLIESLASVPPDEQLEEDHMRARALIARWALAQGQSDHVIERIERNGKTYYAVRDYVRLRKLFGRLLAEVQRIKSEGDLKAAQQLVETFGVQVDPALHREVRARFQALNLAPYTGFVQPRLVAVKAPLGGDDVVDVRIEYPTDFVAQQLDYSARYGFLPTAN